MSCFECFVHIHIYIHIYKYILISYLMLCACVSTWVLPFVDSTQVGKVGNNFEAANSLHRMPRAQKLRCCHASSPSTPRRDPPVEQFGTVSLLLPHTGHGGGGTKKILEHMDVVHDGGISVGTFGNHQAIPEGNPVEIPAHEALTLLTAIIQRPPSTMYSRA